MMHMHGGSVATASPAQLRNGQPFSFGNPLMSNDHTVHARVQDLDGSPGGVDESYNQNQMPLGDGSHLLTNFSRTSQEHSGLPDDEEDEYGNRQSKNVVGSHEFNGQISKVGLQNKLHLAGVGSLKTPAFAANNGKTHFF